MGRVTRAKITEKPTYEEIEESIKKLKNGRAPGEDNIIPEMIKYGGKQLVKKLHELTCVMWRGEKIPEDWETGIICPIYKKGDKLDCNNYRGITLLDIVYKVFSNVLNERLKKLYQVMEDMKILYKLITLVKMTMKNATARVKVTNKLINSFTFNALENTLYSISNNVMPLELLQSSLSPFLNMGQIIPVSQSSGIFSSLTYQFV